MTELKMRFSEALLGEIGFTGEAEVELVYVGQGEYEIQMRVPNDRDDSFQAEIEFNRSGSGSHHRAFGWDLAPDHLREMIGRQPEAMLGQAGRSPYRDIMDRLQREESALFYGDPLQERLRGPEVPYTVVDEVRPSRHPRRVERALTQVDIDNIPRLGDVRTWPAQDIVLNSSQEFIDGTGEFAYVVYDPQRRMYYCSPRPFVTEHFQDREAF